MTRNFRRLVNNIRKIYQFSTITLTAISSFKNMSKKIVIQIQISLNISLFLLKKN